MRVFKVDLADVEKGLRSLEKSGGDIAATLKAFQKPLMADQREHGRQMIGPGGQKWAPRAASTVGRASTQKTLAKLAKGATFKERVAHQSLARRRRIKGANRKLLNSLPNRTLKLRQGSKGLTVYSKVPWAGVHQHGGTVGHGAKIPARPFLWFSFEFISAARQIVIGRLMKAWNA